MVVVVALSRLHRPFGQEEEQQREEEEEEEVQLEEIDPMEKQPPLRLRQEKVSR